MTADPQVGSDVAGEHRSGHTNGSCLENLQCRQGLGRPSHLPPSGGGIPYGVSDPKAKIGAQSTLGHGERGNPWWGPAITGVE